MTPLSPKIAIQPLTLHALSHRSYRSQVTQPQPASVRIEGQMEPQLLTLLMTFAHHTLSKDGVATTIPPNSMPMLFAASVVVVCKSIKIQLLPQTVAMEETIQSQMVEMIRSQMVAMIRSQTVETVVIAASALTPTLETMELPSLQITGEMVVQSMLQTPQDGVEITTTTSSSPKSCVVSAAVEATALLQMEGTTVQCLMVAMKAQSLMVAMMAQALMEAMKAQSLMVAMMAIALMEAMMEQPLMAMLLDSVLILTSQLMELPYCKMTTQMVVQSMQGTQAGVEITITTFSSPKSCAVFVEEAQTPHSLTKAAIQATMTLLSIRAATQATTTLLSLSIRVATQATTTLLLMLSATTMTPPKMAQSSLTNGAMVALNMLNIPSGAVSTKLKNSSLLRCAVLAVAEKTKHQMSWKNVSTWTTVPLITGAMGVPGTLRTQVNVESSTTIPSTLKVCAVPAWVSIASECN